MLVHSHGDLRLGEPGRVVVSVLHEDEEGLGDVLVVTKVVVGEGEHDLMLPLLLVVKVPDKENRKFLYFFAYS